MNQTIFRKADPLKCRASNAVGKSLSFFLSAQKLMVVPMVAKRSARSGDDQRQAREQTHQPVPGLRFCRQPVRAFVNAEDQPIRQWRADAIGQRQNSPARGKRAGPRGE